MKKILNSSFTKYGSRVNTSNSEVYVNNAEIFSSYITEIILYRNFKQKN